MVADFIMNAKTLMFASLVAILVLSILAMFVRRRTRPIPVPESGTFSILKGNVDGHPMVAMIDTSLLRTSNKQRLPFYLNVSTPLANPTSDGLTTRDEANDLNAWEDIIETKLGSATELAFLGRVTSNGHRLRRQQTANRSGSRHAWAGTLDTSLYLYV